MVSKARDDLPEPDRPVMTTSLSRGISTSTFLRLCSRAPLTTILFMGSERAQKAQIPSLTQYQIQWVVNRGSPRAGRCQTGLVQGGAVGIEDRAGARSRAHS